jgi:hypothetical protein
VVALGVASLESPECRLEIVPGSKNQFSVPVTLTADCRTVPSAQLRK